MATHRREFIVTSAAALAAVSFPMSMIADEPVSPTPRNLKILILGGTGFLGPACTESALARGHKVTQFNSGRTEERRHEVGRPSVVPDGVEKLYGNRDPNKTAADRRNEGKAGSAHDADSPKGLSQLAGKSWDAVIDTSGYFPRMVKASAGLLAPSVRQYLFISSISAYRDFSKPEFDESAPLATLADPTVEEMGKNSENYGGGKALCEKAAETAMPGRATIIRPGFIVGPRDTSGKFVYWPARASMGGTMIVPGTPSDPIQLVDVRDLADFIIHCLEGNITGTFNVTGPKKVLPMKQMVEDIRAGIESKVEFTWVENKFLDAQKIADNQFPLYVPPEDSSANIHHCNISRAVEHGLKFRPLSETAKATLDWYRSLPPATQSAIAPQFAKRDNQPAWIEAEKHLLEIWNARSAAKG